MKTNVYVKLKESVLDPEGQAILGALKRMGFDDVEDVRVGKVFEVTLKEGADKEKVKEFADKVLANTIIEDFTVE